MPSSIDALTRRFGTRTPFGNSTTELIRSISAVILVMAVDRKEYACVLSRKVAVCCICAKFMGVETPKSLIPLSVAAVKPCLCHSHYLFLLVSASLLFLYQQDNHCSRETSDTMDGEDDFLGSMGLGKLLASEGVDSSGLNTLLARGGDASASNDYANIDNNSDDEAGYEDDLDDQDLLPETEAEKAARAKEKQEEARYRRMALQMNKELEAKRASASKVKGKSKDDPKDVVKRIWPDFEPGRRLRMTDVLYETPYAREQYKAATYRRKSRKVVHEAKRKFIHRLIHRMS